MPWAMFNRFEFKLTKSDVDSVPLSGPADAAVAAIVKRPYLARQLRVIGPDKIRDELREYGAWDEAELADDASNAERIVWIGACDIREGVY